MCFCSRSCTYTCIMLLLLVELKIGDVASGQTPPPPSLPPSGVEGTIDEVDNSVLFQIVFLTQAGRSMRTTEKAKSSWEQLFTPSLCSFVPPLPSAAFGSESALVLLAVTVCQGANRFLLTGVSVECEVWVFHYFLYQVGIILVWIGLSVPCCVSVKVCINKRCGSARADFIFTCFYMGKISICVYKRWSNADDGADSLCAVYYHILCNYIITANHPPEVAVLCGNTLLQNKHSDLSTSHTH